MTMSQDRFGHLYHMNHPTHLCLLKITVTTQLGILVFLQQFNRVYKLQQLISGCSEHLLPS
jgi:hypothetical protein